MLPRITHPELLLSHSIMKGREGKIKFFSKDLSVRSLFQQLPRRCLSVLGQSHGERINTMILDIINTSMDKPIVDMSEEVRQASDELREFLFAYVYHDDWRKKEEARCDYIVTALFNHYIAHPEQLPGEYLEIVYTEGPERAACDFVGCMTDRYAIDQFTALFVPNAFDKK